MSENLISQIVVRSAKLEDSKAIMRLYNTRGDSFITDEKIRLAIGSSFLNKNSFFVAESDGIILGYIEQIVQNQSHAQLSYPVVIESDNSEEIRIKLVESVLSKLRNFGYQVVSTRLSKLDTIAVEFFGRLDFSDEVTIFRSYTGKIEPIVMASSQEYRRVNINDANLTYNWIKRQLNPNSPIFITEEYFKQLLNAPKHVREGWSMAIDPETRRPLAMISSMIDQSTEDVVIFGPFNGVNGIESRIPLFNELLWFYSMRGHSTFRLMRIDFFDNDSEIIETFNLNLTEHIILLTKQL